MATLVPLLIIVVIFVFMVVAPGRRRAKEAQVMRSSLAPGVDVVTTAGVYGRVDSIDKEQGTVDLEVSDGVIVRFASQAIVRVISSDSDSDADSESEDGLGADDGADGGTDPSAADAGPVDAATDGTATADGGAPEGDRAFGTDKTTDDKRAENGSNRGSDGLSG